MVFSSKDCYLNGIDWVMNTFDKKNKNFTQCGNQSQIVVELEGKIKDKDVENFFKQLLCRLPFLKGSIKRALNLAPYWKFEKSFDFDKLFHFFKPKFKFDKELFDFLHQRSTEPLDEYLLSFDYVVSDQKSYVLMRFDHRILDAHGAEIVLSYLLSQSGNRLNCGGQGANLDSWKSKFFSGQRINRFLRSLFNEDTNLYFDSKNTSKVQHTGSFYSFSPEETKIINKRGAENAGYLMNGIFLLAVSVEAVKNFDAGNKVMGESIIVPVNVDTRNNKQDIKLTFFNHTSFIMYKIPSQSDMADTIRSLKSQFLNQVKGKITYHFFNCCMLLRIAPAKFIGKIMDRVMSGNPFAFSFSYVNNGDFKLNYVAGCKVANILHMPTVPYQPGVGIFFTKHKDRLNLFVSSYNTKLSYAETHDLCSKIKDTLLNGK